MAVPIIVGVGDVRNKSTSVQDAIEPAQLMATAIRAAAADTGLDAGAQRRLLASADALRVVPTWTWAYGDLPATVADYLGINPSTRVHDYHGGNQPALQCDEAARAIASRKSSIAILTGGEALASLAACQKAGQMPPRGWKESDPNGSGVSLDLSMLRESSATRHSMGLPIHVYPLYETARRAHRRQTAAENTQESALMYAAFDKIASDNPYSWNHGEPPKSADAIKTVTKRNRIICHPYPLLMNAFNGVNLSAACILTSTDVAKKLNIPEEKWVYVLGGAGTHEKDNFWERRHFHDSPAIRKAIDAALDVSGLSPSQVDLFDFYSCFPIVPKLACDHLGLSTTKWDKPISLLGGLTSFGGAGNNYSMHAISAMTRRLRAGKRSGLILANGGMLTHQHALCLSSTPSGREYPSLNPIPIIADDYSPSFVESAAGKAIIESYTIEYARDGSPETGLIVGRLSTQERFLANHGDKSTLLDLADIAREHTGRQGRVVSDDGRNLFFFEPASKINLSAAGGAGITLAASI